MKKILILIIALFIVSAKQVKQAEQVVDDRVQVNLYYESLCPGCQNFIKYTLTPAVQVEGFLQIANIKLFPYGNAQSYDDGDVDCQHGDNECYGNILGACSQKYSEQSKHLNFIVCLENNIEDKAENFDIVSNLCYQQLNISSEVQKQIAECQNSDEGQLLLLQAGVDTNALKPNRKYVPWLMVNGSQSDEVQEQGQDDLVAFVCQTYKGNIKLEGCAEYIETQQVQ